MKSKKKGFTLVELIVVLAIIGILSAIIIPSWGYFMRRSRERTANSRAKIVFNAAQTEITRIAQRERTTLNMSDTSNIFQPGTTESVAAKNSLYVGNGTFCFYWNGAKGEKLNMATNVVIKKSSTAEQKALDANNIKFANAVNNICGSDCAYKIYVKDYAVQSVVYCSKTNGRYKGTYPITMGSDGISSSVERSIRNGSVQAADMIGIALT